MKSIEKRIDEAVTVAFDQQLDFLAELVRHPTLRGGEQSGQEYVADELTGRGFQVDTWNLDPVEISNKSGFSPEHANYAQTVNVVGRLASRSRTGRSLTLNGHIDVVPPGPTDMWTSPPFQPFITGDWMYGRGVGDMKAGLSANLFALDALRSIGLRPAGDVLYQSVVEEECTGNGTLACLDRGYRSDVALIPEPFDLQLVTAQVGVLWFQVRVQGHPKHVAYAGERANAIEAAVSLFPSLHRLEHYINQKANRHPEYLHNPRALTLNIGKIRGGEWTSSVPSWCTFDVRIGVFPGQNIDDTKKLVEKTIEDAASDLPVLSNNRPEVIYNGFEAEGYELKADPSELATQARLYVAEAHREIVDRDIEEKAITATTDARLFGLYGNMPALVYGPSAENIHGFDERVNVKSLLDVTRSIALFISKWCGLEEEE